MGKKNNGTPRYKEKNKIFNNGIFAWISTIVIVFVVSLLVNYINYQPVGFNPYYLALFGGVSFVLFIFTIVIESILKVKSFTSSKSYNVKIDFVLDNFKNASRAGKMLILTILCILICIGMNIVSAPIFHAKGYHNCIEVEQVAEEEISSNLPTEKMLNQISLMDTTSASKLGDRTLGSLSDLVSQYQVGEYTTICVDGKIKKIAPLEYTAFFKWANNRSIPGYVLVDPLTNDAEFVRCEQPIVYSPSSYFNENLIRHCRFKYPSLFFATYCFQIDDEGTPYWTITVVEPKSVMKNFVPTGVITVNAATGACEHYDLESVPEWVDNVFDGNTVTSLYNRYGAYINGYWNTQMSQKGITQTTDDFGYIAIDNDIYIYTGVTSISSDESNLGFILTNSRTGEYKYYGIPGAEEYSAMGAAEGLVQNYGYNASFPSLVSINDEATYVMVLKDNNGLVKQYAMVNYKNYTIAVVNNSLDKCLADYLTALNSDGEVVPEPANPDEDATADDQKDSNNDNNSQEKDSQVDDGKIRITNIQFITEDGNTNCYIATSDGHVYFAAFEPGLLLLEEGQEFVDNNYQLVQ